MREKLNSKEFSSIIILFIIWLTYDFLFFKVYEVSIYFVSPNSNLLEKIIFVLNFYLSELYPYFIAIFVILNGTLLTIIFTYLSKKKNGNVNHLFEKILLLIFIVNSFYLLTTILWPIMLFFIVLSLVISFILLIVFKQNDEELDSSYEENEIIKVEGPFDNEWKAKSYYKKFFDYWEKKFLNLDLKLNNRIFMDIDENYYVEVYVTKNKSNGDTEIK